MSVSLPVVVVAFGGGFVAMDVSSSQCGCVWSASSCSVSKKFALGSRYLGGIMNIVRGVDISKVYDPWAL